MTSDVSVWASVAMSLFAKMKERGVLIRSGFAYLGARQRGFDT